MGTSGHPRCPTCPGALEPTHILPCRRLMLAHHCLHVVIALTQALKKRFKKLIHLSSSTISGHAGILSSV